MNKNIIFKLRLKNTINEFKLEIGFKKLKIYIHQTIVKDANKEKSYIYLIFSLHF